MEFGSRREPFEGRVDVEVGKHGVALGALSEETLDVVAMDGNGHAATGTVLANAESGRGTDGGTTRRTPWRWTEAVGHKSGERIAAVKTVFGWDGQGDGVMEWWSAGVLRAVWELGSFGV